MDFKPQSRDVLVKKLCIIVEKQILEEKAASHTGTKVAKKGKFQSIDYLDF